MTPRCLCVVVGLGLWGCIVSAETEVVHADVTSGGNANGDALGSTGPVAVVWSAITTETPGCFFFSGPTDLGRDDHLGSSGVLDASERGATLAFDGGPVFTGTMLGATIALGRSAPYEFSGTWTTRETITLASSGPDWVGHYHYDEIDPSTGRPSSCHIDATIAITRR
jgi:hypothetical protein